MRWELQKIIDIANCLIHTGNTGASVAERIAAAFVLNRQDYLPASYPHMVDAWDRLGDHWQGFVRQIIRDYMHLIDETA